MVGDNHYTHLHYSAQGSVLTNSHGAVLMNEPWVQVRAK